MGDQILNTKAPNLKFQNPMHYIHKLAIGDLSITEGFELDAWCLTACLWAAVNP